MHVVIVESPAKAKTINKYLGSGYKVLASYGHVRDLPSKDGSVDPDNDFAMVWDVDRDSGKRLTEISKAVKGADGLILATDPDREGEAISWHILEVLKKKGALKGVDVSRVAFNQITKRAIGEAMAKPRQIDGELVDAYLARRALDYLVGFSLSPVLWRKLPGSRSAGRVQSVALRLIVDREMEIERFVRQEYWTIEAVLTTEDGETFTARLARLDGKTVKKLEIGDGETAKKVADQIRAAALAITSVEAKPVRRNPPPPFTTSTLQQEASRKLGFDASRTMRAAQRLYEGVDTGGGESAGLITYMRTDGVDMAWEAVNDARGVISATFGARYQPEKPRVYKTKAKNAQEAHECIRPTDFSRQPKHLHLSGDEAKLYDLIWKRAIASQMEAAEMERTTIDVDAADGTVGLRATGTVITFDGFLKLYQEGRDEPEDDEDGARLPPVKQGATAKADEVKTDQHFTEPPPRYSEASLVKKMEELGIGRPSTYASVLSVLRDRSYVRMERSRFVPEDKGRLVTHFLENYFARYVEYGFTADLEEKLDLVSDGKIAWKDLLRDFWRDFSAAIAETAELRVSDVLERLNEALEPYLFPQKEDGSDPRGCPLCGAGRLSLKTGKFGAFVGCSNYPDCKYTRPFSTAAEEEAAHEGPKVLGEIDGEEVTLRSGRFGQYVQKGEGEKPPRASLPKGWEPGDMDIEKAAMLLSLPRPVGAHPETGEMIEAGIGRYGPYVKHERTYVNLPSVDEVFTVGINRAVDLIASKSFKNRKAAEPLKALGEHPEDGAPVAVMDGRYGPYVKWNKINATLPKGSDPAAVTMESAVKLLAEKAAKSPAKGRGGAKKSSGKKKAAPAKAAE